MSNVPLPPIYENYAGKWIDVEDARAYAAAVSAAKDAEIAQLRAELIKSLADNAALRAEVAGLREDAGRYRHMRNNSQFQLRNGPGLYWCLPRYGQGDEGEQLDAAIDAARKGEA